jgi:polyisoprenyl-teichoic acid--peptidoglycan teichoic acid transferase
VARFRSTIAVIVVAVLVVLALAVVGLWSGLRNIAPRTSLTDLVALVDPSAASNGSLAWKMQHSQRINVLLMARGGAGNDNPSVTDTLVVLSVQPGSRQALLISLPRFAWVRIPALRNGDISGKLYTAYALGIHQDNPSLRPEWRTATGAGDLAAATVAQLTGLTIDGWVAIDIEGFRNIVDALGGIEVAVPAVLDDAAYPVDVTERTMHVHIGAGHQLMDGAQALVYARSRLSTSESDRSKRQQLILLAIAERMRSGSLGPRLVPLLGALQGRLLTNLQPSDARKLAQLVEELRGSGVYRITIDTSNLVYSQPEPGGDEVLQPRDGTFATLRRYLQRALPPLDRAQHSTRIVITDASPDFVLPTGETPAGVIAGLLRDVGWNAVVGPDRRGDKLAHSRMTANTTPDHIAAAGFIGELLQLSRENPLPPSPDHTVEVVLGSDSTSRLFMPPAR